jgi:hypothetical protein
VSLPEPRTIIIIGSYNPLLWRVITKIIEYNSARARGAIYQRRGGKLPAESQERMRLHQLATLIQYLCFIIKGREF